MAQTLLPAIIILAIILLCIILFVVVHKRTQNKKLLRQKVVFADCVWKHKLDISESETINNYLLALDKTNFIMLYIRFSGVKEVVHLIDLWNVKEVNVVPEYNKLYEYSQGKNVLADKQITNLHLEVTFTDNLQPKLRLFLYESWDGMQDFVHIKRRANYWTGIINASLSELPYPAKHNA